MRTYKQAFDLLTIAYISGAVNPYDCAACFCGNLLGGDKWSLLSVMNSAKLFYAPEPIPNEELFALKVAAENEYGLSPEGVNDLVRSIGYTPEEIQKLEIVFLKKLNEVLGITNEKCLFLGAYLPKDPNQQAIKNGLIYNLLYENKRQMPLWEDALFAAFEVTLEELKQIHISKGEIIEDTPPFVRREKKELALA